MHICFEQCRAALHHQDAAAMINLCGRSTYLFNEGWFILVRAVLLASKVIAAPLIAAIIISAAMNRPPLAICLALRPTVDELDCTTRSLESR